MSMLTVAAVRQAAREQVTRRLGDWVGREAAADQAPFTHSFSLKPPTERQALADLPGAKAWVSDWRAEALPVGACLDWETRDWSRIGRQEVPVRIYWESPDSVAKFAGGSTASSWQTARDRAAEAVARFGTSPELGAVLRRHVRTLLAYSPEEWRQVLDAVAWLSAQAVTGLRPRQLPIRGVDTKWFATHRSVVTELLAVVAPHHELGVVDSDALSRLRVLDARLAPGSPHDFAAPITQLAELALEPRTVFVFENKESVLAMPPWPGAVVLHGSGYSVAQLMELPWVQRSRVIYWGDLDSHGFAILHRARCHHPGVSSVLMDEATLLTLRDLWVAEPKPTRGEFSTLRPAESRTLERLRNEGDVRLEQERIPWEVALAALRAADETVAASVAALPNQE
ncbi:Wadjet anti-phage system protein JetD domain-containing protein [Leucobacter sp. W1478]|uniref:Wadjet anti-phage system protein JetD domain-containing protein n=1 Tax=Leucobacter sp. W1478 TaxID=3439065 RepID=UPI003F300685